MRVQKKALLKFIRARDTVTFEDIETFFTEKQYDFRGDVGMVFEPSKLVTWNGWNRRTSRTFQDLLRDGKIEVVHVSMSEAPIPPAFRNVTGLSGMNYIPVKIRAVR